MSQTTSSAAIDSNAGFVRRRYRFGTGAVLVLGALVVPIALSMIFNSYDAPDAAAFVRMAFASVAGSTIGIVTALGLVVHRIIRRSSLPNIIRLSVVALIVVSWHGSGLVRAAEVLLQRLALG